VRKVDEGLAGVRKPGGVGGVGAVDGARSMVGGEGGEALAFLEGRGEGEDMQAFAVDEKTEAYIDLFVFFIFFIFF
jgi:hypothetical protein